MLKNKKKDASTKCFNGTTEQLGEGKGAGDCMKGGIFCNRKKIFSFLCSKCGSSCQLELPYELPIKKPMAVLIMPTINELIAIPGICQHSFQGYISEIPYYIAHHLGKCDIRLPANSQSGGWTDRGIQAYIL